MFVTNFRMLEKLEEKSYNLRLDWDSHDHNLTGDVISVGVQLAEIFPTDGFFPLYWRLVQMQFSTCH